MERTQNRTVQEKTEKQDADYIFYELTRSICPTCRRVIDAHVLLRDNKVYMRKRCPEHGQFEGLIYSDAEAYISSSRYNKPGTIPLQFSTEIERRADWATLDHAWESPEALPTLDEIESPELWLQRIG